MRRLATLLFILLLPSLAFAEQTLSMIKPNAIKAGHSGQIIAQIEASNLKVVGIKMVQLSDAQAREFYYMLKDKYFFEELVEFMTSGPVIVQVLEGDNAIENYRNLMGDTDPAKAEEGTLRSQFATSKGENAVHGSDSKESAEREIKFFFSDKEIFS